MILTRFVDFDVTLTTALPWKLDVLFSTIFLVNNGHGAIKVHVYKVQYCRAVDRLLVCR